MTSLFSHEVHSQLQMCALPWRRAFNYYKIYKYGEKTKLLIRIYAYNIRIYKMRDINSLRDCALDIWTGMLFHKIAPL